ncbi:glycosyltransferase [Erwinia sorbitola]|uniref:Glycosyltransferase n=1 Tax=Erwinia sorbitola TaxID=2681984 RepID=A0A6I6ESI2_9GAMM|nr:glycosyltransferase [Erwinia sorbitola]QGU89791.1 glycosyltransferase [Erwinia sorbitola]
MTQSPLLSVVVPLYNAGELFAPFMASLLAQTFEDLEIIIVDDGSTDGSGERADEYARQKSNITVIHQENGGVSCARNTGMKHIRGTYVTFPDADDILEPDLYSTLMAMVRTDDLDVAQCNALRTSSLYGPGTILIPLNRLRSTQIMSGTSWLDRALKTRRYLHVVWLGVYRVSLIKQANLQFVPGLHHQDILWTTEFMLNARRVRYNERALYHYLLHSESISNRPRVGQPNVEYQRHYLRICQRLEELNQQYSHSVKIHRSFHAQIFREALIVCHAIRREPDEAARQAMIADFLATDTLSRMRRNARGLKQRYHLLLWHYRLWWWRKSAQAHT